MEGLATQVEWWSASLGLFVDFFVVKALNSELPGTSSFSRFL
jgi:hypothetical protein